jgi:hypothetical protein
MLPGAPAAVSAPALLLLHTPAHTLTTSHTQNDHSALHRHIASTPLHSNISFHSCSTTLQKSRGAPAAVSACSVAAAHPSFALHHIAYTQNKYSARITALRMLQSNHAHLLL